MDTRRTSFSSAGSCPALEDDPDELIPTAVVIKNIPFAVKRDQLLDAMQQLGLPLPYAFNYHFDNGVFRGLAFANFHSPAETSVVVAALHGREMGGRKLRVEYKKMLPAGERDRLEREKRERRGQLEEQHRNDSHVSLASLSSIGSTTNTQATAGTNNASAPLTQPSSLIPNSKPNYVVLSSASQAVPAPSLNLNDPEILEIYTKLVVFRDSINSPFTELVFSLLSMSSTQSKYVVVLAEYLGLALSSHQSELIVRRINPLTNSSNGLNISMNNVQHQHQQNQPHSSQQQQQQQQVPPQQISLIRSQTLNSTSSPNSVSGLTFQTNRLRQQPRSVSQTHQQQFSSLSALAASPSSQTVPMLHHSSSNVSLNLLRSSTGASAAGNGGIGGGLTAPATPNPSHARANPNQWFNNPQLTGGSLSVNAGSTQSMLTQHTHGQQSQQLTGGSFTSTTHQMTGGSFISNQPQLTGGSFSNVDDLFASLDNLTLQHNSNHIQL